MFVSDEHALCVGSCERFLSLRQRRRLLHRYGQSAVFGVHDRSIYEYTVPNVKRKIDAFSRLLSLRYKFRGHCFVVMSSRADFYA